MYEKLIKKIISMRIASLQKLFQNIGNKPKIDDIFTLSIKSFCQDKITRWNFLAWFREHQTFFSGKKLLVLNFKITQQNETIIYDLKIIVNILGKMVVVIRPFWRLYLLRILNCEFPPDMDVRQYFGSKDIVRNSWRIMTDVEQSWIF